jgi:hypothetical protein
MKTRVLKSYRVEFFDDHKAYLFTLYFHSYSRRRIPFLIRSYMNRHYIQVAPLVDSIIITCYSDSFKSFKL